MSRRVFGAFFQVFMGVKFCDMPQKLITHHVIVFRRHFFPNKIQAYINIDTVEEGGTTF
jgi:hypothetical protein